MAIASDLNRVFFHELGHYIASEINLNNFGVFGVTKSIVISKSKLTGGYNGYTYPFTIEYKTNDTANKHLAARLAVLVYGSLFEALFRGDNLQLYFAQHRSGQHDLKQWNKLVRSANAQPSQLEQLHQNDLTHFNAVVSEAGYSSVMRLNPQDYLIKENDHTENYSVNLSRLSMDLSAFIAQHSTVYVSYVSNTRAILQGSNFISSNNL